MVYTPQPYYRSESARKLAERVASGEGLNSLNVTINIDTILPNRDESDLQSILLAIAENRSFVLYSDQNHYCIIIPRNLVVCCYVDGVQGTVEAMKDMQQFQNRVKIALVVYDKFHPIDRCIEDRGHGDGTVSEVGKRKDLPDGT